MTPLQKTNDIFFLLLFSHGSNDNGATADLVRSSLFSKVRERIRLSVFFFLHNNQTCTFSASLLRSETLIPKPRSQ